MTAVKAPPMMDAMQGPPSPLPVFQGAMAYQRSDALKAAVDLGLFTAIGGDTLTAAQIAERCRVPERGIRILSDFLTIHEYLEKESGAYRLTRDSAMFLDANS